MENFIHNSFTIDNIIIRIIEKKDNNAVAHIIRSTLKEFGANHPGTVYYDESTDHLYEVFSTTPHAVYFVAQYQGEVIGGAGIFPSSGLPHDTCELVKMYLLPNARGMGLGKNLIQKCIDYAIDEGYQQIYLESMPELKKALKIYEKFGFEYLKGPMGNTGHYGCELWMLKKLES